MMYIRSIASYEKDDNEADIYVTDGDFQVLCYVSDMKTLKSNEAVSLVCAYGCSNVQLSDVKHFELHKLHDHYAYSFVGRILSKSNRLICIGKINIELDTEIPNDCSIGDYVEFSVIRLDCIPYT